MTEHINVDGEPVPFTPGQSIAAALIAADRPVLRRTRTRAPRGVFCGIGACFDCLVTLNGAGYQQACLTSAVDGDEVDTRTDGRAP